MVVYGDLPFDFRVYRAARTLADAGHRITVLSPAFGGEPLPALWDAFDVQTLAVERGGSLRRSYPRFWRWAARRAIDTKADVYHAHDLDALWPAARAARRHGVPLVYDSHELFTGQSSLVHRRGVRTFWRLLEARLLPRAQRVVTVSDAIAGQLQRLYRLHERPAVVRNLPPRREPLADDRLRRALPARVGDAPLALYQGGFLTDNGLAQVIGAMAHVEGAHLVLLGSGPTESELRQLVDASDLGGRVHFLPRVPFADLHAWSCGADIGLCVIRPAGESFAGALPNKLFEYFQAGLPVIGGDTPAIRAVIEATDAGLTVDPFDPLAIAGALTRLVDDDDLRQRCAAAAAAAAESYCWEAEAPRLLAVYEGL